jgi:hypothetical protein
MRMHKVIILRNMRRIILLFAILLIDCNTPANNLIKTKDLRTLGNNIMCKKTL